MTEAKDRLRYLLNQYANEISSQEEENELFTIVEEGREDIIIKSIMLEMLHDSQAMTEFDPSQWEFILQKVINSEGARIYSLTKQKKKTRSINWKRIVAAAVIILMVGVGYYFVIFKKEPTPQISSIPTQEERFKNDIKPGRNVPQLVLADGRRVNLDSAHQGALALEGSVKVTRLPNGEIIYDATAKTTEVRYNTITNPSGSKVVSLTLADGSQVWLDAASSIRYPTAFVSKERRVEITGQAYFEVKHNAARPFKVQIKSVNGINRGEVEVLGTHFNINAYEGETVVKTTLLEGEVRISNYNQVQTLTPGQQAQFNDKASIFRISNNVAIDEVMAWKNGRFYFNGTDIKTIMRQIERWYDVQISYEGSAPTDTFVTSIPRDVPVSHILKILETTGRVRFRIEGRNVVVMH